MHISNAKASRETFARLACLTHLQGLELRECIESARTVGIVHDPVIQLGEKVREVEWAVDLCILSDVPIA